MTADLDLKRDLPPSTSTTSTQLISASTQLSATPSTIFESCLLLQLKPWGVRGASQQPAFMSNRRANSHTNYSPIYPVDEGNEDVGLV